MEDENEDENEDEEEAEADRDAVDLISAEGSFIVGLWSKPHNLKSGRKSRGKLRKSQNHGWNQVTWSFAGMTR